MMKKKSSARSRRIWVAKPGPRAPITPISDEAMPRYVRDQAMRGVRRTKAMPSRSSSSIAVRARPAAAAPAAVVISGGTPGIGRMARAASPNMIATTT